MNRFLDSLAVIGKLHKRKRLPCTTIKGALSDVLGRAGFELIDIGARRGAMPQLALLAPFSHYYACEPDREEASRLSTKLRESAPWRDITVIPEAMSLNETRAVLYITKQPGLSSLFRPNDTVVKRYYRGDEFQIVSTTPVFTISLDHAAERYGFRDACFLKIDTQGSELDILRSGSKLLQQAVVGVYVEVLFHGFYMGQPLFSDIDSYLRSLDFSLFDLHRSLVRRASYRDHLYSRRQVVWAHALYLKEPETILQINEAALLKASRLLGLAIAFEHYDLALELTTSGRSATLFFEAYGSRVRDGVEELVAHETKTALKKTRSGRNSLDVTAFAYRDRDHI